MNRQPNEGVSVMKPLAFIVHLMARGERMEAWLMRSSRQPSPLVSSMWSSVCFLVPPTSKTKRLEKQMPILGWKIYYDEVPACLHFPNSKSTF